MEMRVHRRFAYAPRLAGVEVRSPRMGLRNRCLRGKDTERIEKTLRAFFRIIGVMAFLAVVGMGAYVTASIWAWLR